MCRIGWDRLAKHEKSSVLFKHSNQGGYSFVFRFAVSR